MRRFIFLLFVLVLFGGCELVNSITGEWGGHNRVVDRALKSPNESIQEEAAGVRQHADQSAEVPVFPVK
jgi:hypothetical protein